MCVLIVFLFIFSSSFRFAVVPFFIYFYLCFGDFFSMCSIRLSERDEKKMRQKKKESTEFFPAASVYLLRSKCLVRWPIWPLLKMLVHRLTKMGIKEKINNNK